VLGQLQLARDDHRAALRAFKYALDRDPTLGSASLLAATVLLRMRDFEEARRLLEAAARTVDPVEERTRLRLLAVALRGVRRYDEAAEVYERLLAVAKPDPVDVYNRAHLELYRLEHQDDIDRAQVETVEKWFTKAIAAMGDDPAHAEIRLRAQAELRALDELIGPPISVHKALDAEAQELERLDRAQQKEERERLLEVEAKAREEFERGGGERVPPR
jgi:tetratricopeptide (TPR) repeat protein